MQKVIIHKINPDEAGGYWVECPSIGIVSQGETVEQALVNSREAITRWLDVALEYSDPIPSEDRGAFRRMGVL